MGNIYTLNPCEKCGSNSLSIEKRMNGYVTCMECGHKKLYEKWGHYDDPSERDKNNLLILKIIQDYLKSHPDIRFNQALHNLNIISKDRDSYYDEPQDVLGRINDGKH